MAGGGGAQSRSLEQTPTWAVAGVCLVLLAISIAIEHVIELIGKWLKKAHRKALYEALEKIKSELMLMGFISLLLTVGSSPISKICVSKSAGDSWHPCNESEQRALNKDDGDEEHESEGPLGSMFQNKVPLISSDAIHQLHVFIFVLAVFHVLYSILTMALGKANVCFFRQFVRSVPKIDYLTLRHGFIMAHLAPRSATKFDFQNYIKRSLEDDFKVVVGIRVLIQILCSYVTLPLYALVTQMGSNMKPTVFSERVATALRKWHHTARKHLKESRKSGSVTPTSTSRPATPAHGFSPVHLLQNYRISDANSLQTSPIRFNAASHYDRHERWEIEDLSTTTDEGGSSSYHHQREKQREMEDVEGGGVDVVVMREPARDEEAQRGIEVGSSVSDFSFDKRITQ
ncbi:MLO-like protein 2 [Acorus calamus]|uniref:MLO-like protein n=1 Tax=Acorus calamus TaxID=4465 RepID=A0AAV9CPR1_ACOCL|nr:MLO-like protein 2 [Acorus calamus]